jgi:Rhodopirellula transposase DDE domain
MQQSCHEVFIETIAAETTRTGLPVHAGIGYWGLTKRVKLSEREMQALEQRSARREEFHGGWNYSPLPTPRTTSEITEAIPR